MAAIRVRLKMVVKEGNDSWNVDDVFPSFLLTGSVSEDSPGCDLGRPQRRLRLLWSDSGGLLAKISV